MISTSLVAFLLETPCEIWNERVTDSSQNYKSKAYHELFLLTQSFLAQKHDGRFEDEAHGVQLETLLDFAQEVGDVQPLDATVVQEVTYMGIKVDRSVCPEEFAGSGVSHLTRTKIDRLFAGLLVLAEQVVEDGAVLFVDSLHFVDVLGDLFHALERFDQVQVFGCVGVGQVSELLKQ